MFTPGFRLFAGFAAAGFVAMFVYAVASGGDGTIDYFGFVDASAWVGAISFGWKGGVGDHLGYFILLFFVIAAGWLAGMLVAFRDADPEAVAELNGGVLPPAQGPSGPNYWPLIGGFGVAVAIIGLALNAAIFVIGLLLILAATFEWMMSAWADRATGDPVANQELRDRIMKPIEVPVLSAIGVAVVILAMSRVFLAVSKEWAVWVAVIVSAVVFFAAVAMVVVDKVNKNLVAGVLSIGAIALLAGGVVSASVGEREFKNLAEEKLEELEAEGIDVSVAEPDEEGMGVDE
ncbi:MAG: hypothetical protein ACE367_23830 [Acidimicrobiales bacterium]